MKKLAILALVVGACGSDGNIGDHDGDAGPPPLDILAVDVTPGDVLLQVDNGVAETQLYAATGHLRNGNTIDVTDAVTWIVDDSSLGGFYGTTFKPNGMIAGRSKVLARYRSTTGTVEGEGKLAIRLSSTNVRPGAPANAPDLFGAATDDPGHKPAIVYPETSTMVPPNLGDFDVHWADAAHDLWEVRIQADLLDVRAYVAAASARGNGGFWTSFQASEWIAIGESMRGDSVSVTVRGLTTAAPQTAGASAPLSIQVSDDDIAGGLYYWTPYSPGVMNPGNNQTGGVFRHDFGKPADPPEAFYNPATPGEGARCVGCHYLSRDGVRMAGTWSGGNGAAFLLDVASRTPLSWSGSFISNFTILEPHGNRMLTTYNGVIQLRDANSAQVITSVPLPDRHGTHPDWSPTGELIAYTSYNTDGQSDWSVSDGRLIVQSFDGPNNRFGTPVERVARPAGGTIHYPVFSADGKWIMYNSSPNSAGSSYNNPNADIWVVATDGSVPPMKLSRALGALAGQTNSWGRWTPFVQSTGGPNAEPLLWFTFSSKRAFGVRLAAGQPQLWMAPFFPNRATGTLDPSGPAFHLPFQDLASPNHIAQWTQAVIPIGKPL